jgi:hypothetical protein
VSVPVPVAGQGGLLGDFVLHCGGRQVFGGSGAMGGHGGGVVGWVVVWLGYFTVDSNRAKYNRKGCVYKYTERPFENNGMNNSTLNKGGRGVSCGRRGDMGQTGKGIE